MEIAPTGLEPHEKLLGKQLEPGDGGTESGTKEEFAHAIAALMRLPLPDELKAEAIRRMLSRNGGKS